MALPQNLHNEKRSFIRLKIDTMVTFTITGGSSERYQGRCKNISGAGLLIETEKKLKVGTRISVTVPSENSEFSNLNTTAEVIRCNALRDQHKFEIGLVIKQVNS